MGNLVTKYTTNNMELNESNASDVVDSEQVAKTEVKTPAVLGQTRTGLFKNIWNYDPRSPSSFISRTPISIFRSNSASKFKFNHQELNESIESQVDLDILTPEEQNSLDSNKDLANNVLIVDDLIADPRSPITEITRTPIALPIAKEEAKKKKEENLVKTLADKLISTAISNGEEMTDEKLPIKKSKNQKNLIYEDDENLDRYSTPPKKITATFKDAAARTPLSCVGNTHTPKSRSFIPTSTPKSKGNMIEFGDENQRSRIPVSARRLH